MACIEYRFKTILSLLRGSHVSKFIFEPFHLLLEDERRSTRYHGRTVKDVMEQQSAITDKLQSIIEYRPS